MSSFFTLPASQKKRKREDRAAAPGSKKRGVGANGESGAKGASRTRERDQSISGSDIDEDEASAASAGSGEESGSESDEGETAADRRLKLAERYLDNVREEVDDVGFDAAEIDRDLIAERLKEDVICITVLLLLDSWLMVFAHRMNSKDGVTVRSLQTWNSQPLPIRFSAQIPSLQRPSLFTRHLSTPSPRIKP